MYYVLKKERSFTDYPEPFNLQAKNGLSILGASYSTPDASANFADYIGKVMHEDLEKANFQSKLLSIAWWQDWFSCYWTRNDLCYFYVWGYTCT